MAFIKKNQYGDYKLVTESLPKVIGLVFLGFFVLCILLGTFSIVPAGHRGVVLWWGSVEKRIMGEGLNFKVPIAEKVVKVDVKIQPHPFKEIEASSKEYQSVKMTGMMNFHIDPSHVSDLYQNVGLDFANKVIDPAFNDFVKEVAPNYSITEILPKREEIRKKAQAKLSENLARYHIIIDDIYFSNIRFAPGYEKAIEEKQVAQQQVETHKQILAQREIEAKQKVAVARGDAESKIVNAEGEAKAAVANAKGEAESILIVASSKAKANEAIAKTVTPLLVQYNLVHQWDGKRPMIEGSGSGLLLQIPSLQPSH